LTFPVPDTIVICSKRSSVLSAVSLFVWKRL
jgi:hypothetical protein